MEGRAECNSAIWQITNLRSDMVIRRYMRLWLALVALALVSGCSTPDLRLVSKPAMQFGQARGYATASRLVPQIEPGRMATGGAQASVCAYCR